MNQNFLPCCSCSELLLWELTSLILLIGVIAMGIWAFILKRRLRALTVGENHPNESSLQGDSGMTSGPYPNYTLIRELLEDVAFNAENDRSLRVPLQDTKYSREDVERHLFLCEERGYVHISHRDMTRVAVIGFPTERGYNYLMRLRGIHK